MQLFEETLFGEQSTPLKEGCNVIKACLFTLIVISKDIEHAKRCQRIVTHIAQKFPCKVIFIAIESGSENYLNKKSSTYVISNGSKTPISCDILTIQCSLDQLPRIPFLVIPEVVADLPTYMILSHDPCEHSTLIDQLQPYVEKIVFDMPEIPNVGKFARNILFFDKRSKFIDLHWARIKPWRECFNKIFNREEKLAHLLNATTIDIRYSRRSTTRPEIHFDTEALYLQAWLANRLGWKLSSVKNSSLCTRIEYLTKNRTIELVLTPTESEIMVEGSIVNIEIQGENSLHYLLSYETDDRHIVVHSSTHDRCEIPYSLFVGSFQKGHALPGEIIQQGASSCYFPMLEMLSQPEWDHDRM